RANVITLETEVPMKLLAAFLILAAAARPALAQDPETDRLKREVEKLKTDNAVLLRQLEVVAAQMKELNEKSAKKADGERPSAAQLAKALELAAPTPLEGKVTAVSNEIGLVVISLGSEY